MAVGFAGLTANRFQPPKLQKRKEKGDEEDKTHTNRHLSYSNPYSNTLNLQIHTKNKELQTKHVDFSYLHHMSSSFSILVLDSRRGDEGLRESSFLSQIGDSPETRRKSH
jgi:hypothetical protein